jgi:hypothetical protein
MSVPFLVADVGLQTIIVITLIVIGVVSQLIAKLNEVQKAPPRPPARPNPSNPSNDPLADQIAEFLERAQQRRKTSRPASPLPQTARPLRPTPLPSRNAPAEVIVLEDAGSGASVADHVSSYMSERKRDPVGSELGKEVAQSDEHLEQRLHSVFDHRLGNLSGSPGETSETPRVDESAAAAARIDAPSGSAAGLAALLANPSGMRQAVLVSEILQRPEHRWS